MQTDPVQTDPVQTADEEDLRLLGASLRKLLDRAGGAGRARALRDQDRPWDPAMMAELAAAGVLGVAVPEAAGGLGMGLAAAGIVAAETGRALAPEPVVPTIALAAGLLARLCPEDPLTARVIAGDEVLALAWQDRAGTGPSAAERGADGRITARRSWVAATGLATGLLVVAGDPARPALVLVRPDAEGLEITPRRQADGSTLAEIALSGTPAETLAEGPEVAAALAGAVADATALCAAELVGLCGRALEITLDYIRTREQFDRPIAAFQVIQHRAVDLRIQQDLAEATIAEALRRMDAAGPGPARAPEASRAKARACATARRITRDAIQLHGAVGYTDEYDIGLYLNRALVLSAWLHDETHHRRLWLAAHQTTMEAAQ